MSALTRRRYPERQDCWHVCYGDVHVGTIAIRTGIPHDEDPWGWTCGFYPGSRPGEHTGGSAPTFDEARVGLEADWQVFLSNRMEADFDKCRRSAHGPHENKPCGTTAAGCRRNRPMAGRGASVVKRSISRAPRSMSTRPTWRMRDTHES
jgi:hypothetical protein